MTAFFLIVLTSIWIALFVGAYLRLRDSAPLSSTERFQRSMEVLGTSSEGRWIVVPTYDPAVHASLRRGRRLRRILAVLLIAAGASAVAAALRGGAMWTVHLGADALLAIYVALLISAKKRRLERQNVRSMTKRGAASSATPLPRLRAAGERFG